MKFYWEQGIIVFCTCACIEDNMNVFQTFNFTDILLTSDEMTTLY